MNMKWFKKYVLPAVLAAAVPISANAAGTFDIAGKTGILTSTDHIVGARLRIADPDDNKPVTVWGDSTTQLSEMVNVDPRTGGTAGAGSTYNVGAFDIVAKGGNVNAYNAVMTDDLTGTFNFENISIKTDPSVTANWEVQGLQISTGASGAFAGTINGKDIVVNSTAVPGAAPSYGEAYGVRMRGDTNYQGDVSGKIHFDSIDVTGNGFSAAFVTGDIVDEGAVTIGNVKVTSNQGEAWGVQLNSNPAAGTGTLLVDAMEIKGKGGALGLTIHNGGAQTGTFVSEVAATVGAITTTSESGLSAGVSGAEIKNLVVTGNITSTSGTGQGFAMQTTAGDLAYTVAEGKDVVFSGSTAGTESVGDTTSTVGKDAKQIVHGTVAGGKVINDGEGTSEYHNGVQAAAFVVGDKATVKHYYTAGDNLGDAVGNYTTYTDDAEAAKGAYRSLDGKNLIKSEGGDYLATGDGTTMTFTATGTNSLSNGFVAAAGMHQRYSAWNSVRDRMISATGNRRGILGQECDPCDVVAACDPCDPCGTYGIGGERSLARNAWVNYVGRGEEYNAAFNGGKWKLGMDGVQVGTDLYKTSRNQFGVIFGYEGGNLINANNRVDADDIYAGFYGAHVFNNGFDIRGSFAYGWQDYKMVRQSEINQAFFGSKFDGTTTESTVEIGKRFFNGNWSMRPVFAVDVMSNELDKAQEYNPAGAVAGYTYGKTDFTQVFLRTGTDLRWQLRRLTFNSGIYYSYDIDGDNLVAYANDGVNAPIKMVGSDMGRELLTFNVGGEYQFNNFSVFGGYQGQAVLDTASNAYQSIGYVGGAWKW